MLKDKYKHLFAIYKGVREQIESIPDKEDRQEFYGEMVQLELDLKEKRIEKGENAYEG